MSTFSWSVPQTTDGTGAAVPVQCEGESVEKVVPETAVDLSGRDLGSGTLFLTTKRLVWLGNIQAFQVDYRTVVLHAVSRDMNSFNRACLYCQLDGPVSQATTAASAAENEVDEEDIMEMRLIPRDDSVLDSLFASFCEMAAMNPDPSDDSGGEDDELITPGNVQSFLQADWQPDESFDNEPEGEEQEGEDEYIADP